ncbi:flippase [Thalassobacillus devorans]|uniref:flippase n=1 Tax=Thalassobacillus devorans TaxID=279813 RepID=UPI00048ED9F8|nr:flippase [Thalassobacillus devorans]
MIKKILYKNDFIIKLLQSFFGKVSYTLLTMVFTFLCTRLFGAEEFGKYTFGYTVVILFMILAKAGLDNGLIFNIPKNGSKQISFVFLFNFLLSIIIMVILLLFISDPITIILLPLIWMLSMEQLFFGIYRASNNIKGFYIINGFWSLLLRISLLLIFYYFLSKNVASIVLAVYISVTFSILLYFYQNKSKFHKIYVDKDILKYSAPLMFSSFIGILIDKTDILMIGYFSTNTSVGIYQVTVQVSNLLLMCLIIFNTVFAPKISTLYHLGKLEKLKTIYLKSTKYLFFTGMLLSLFLILFREEILVVFGREFVEGGYALTLRVIGQFINISVGGVWIMLAMTGKPIYQMYTNLITCILNISLNLILIPKYGINGAAIASMISLILMNLTGFVLVLKQFDINIKDFMKIR